MIRTTTRTIISIYEQNMIMIIIMITTTAIRRITI
jgi:hypothetical protein